MHASKKTAPRAAAGPHREDMSRALGISIIIHVLVLLAFIIGMPRMRTEVQPATPVSVELVQVDDITQSRAARPSSPEPPKPTKPPQKPEPAPSNTASAPPDLVKPGAPDIQDSPPDDAGVPMPDKAAPDRRGETQQDSAQNPPTPARRPDRPVQKPDKEEPRKRASEEKAFESVLRNLAEREEDEPDTSNREDVQTTDEEAIAAERMTNRLSLSEQDALRQQLSRCWNVMAGARNSEDLAVEVRLFMNPDRTVRQAQILDKQRYRSDSFYRAAADSALRAVRHPQCSPLRLPPDKYEQWKTIVVRFDPSEMF